MLTKEQIEQICEEIKQEKGVQSKGFLLAGSYVYGTPHEHSDLDIRAVTNDGTNWRDKQSSRFGTQADFYYNLPQVVRDSFEKSKQTAKPSFVHAWAYGVIVYDPNGIVAQLQQEARKIWQEGPATGRWIPHEKYRTREVITRKEFEERW